MKAKSILTAAALFAAALFILDVPAAYATVTWDGQANDGLWSSPTNWSADALPTINDDVVFPVMTGAYTVTMDANPGYAQTLDMHANATISISDQRRLEIGSADGQTSNVDGDIVLPYDESVLRLMYNHIIQPKTATTGVAEIIGEHNNAVIDDDPNNASSLTIQDGSGLETIIKGALEIRLDLANNSLVHANDYTTQNTRDKLECWSGTFSGSGEWKVDTASAFLTFRSGVTATGLTGPVTVGPGTLDVNANVTTTDNLSLSTGGKVDVEASDTFTAG